MRGIAAATMIAMAIASGACGATKSNVLAPAQGIGTQQRSVSDTNQTGAGGGAYITADEQFGVGIRAGTASGGQSTNAPVCAGADPTCFEP